MSGYVPNNRGERPAQKAEPYNGEFDKQPRRPLVFTDQPKKLPEQPKRAGCVFAKSCNLPDGVIDHTNPGGFVPLEQLREYGDWAVLATGTVISASGTPLQLIGSSTPAASLASRLGGSFSLGLTKTAVPLGTGAAVGTVAMLLPNNSLSPDSAFYTKEQYHALSLGRTRFRVHVKQLTSGGISAYGFYTGNNPAWEKVPVIAASARGDQFVANLGQGIEVIWTPAADSAELGIPVLEGASQLPTVWVYPPTEHANKALVNPVHPPDYEDAIIWFPATEIPAVYVSLSVPLDWSYYPAPKGLTAFPDARIAAPKTAMGGGRLRKRWKDSAGRIYEWDYQHGAVELYSKQGKHLGEYDPETGEQTKPADPAREVEK